MASDRGYLEFILEQLAELDGVRARAMMGEYILYYRDRVIGGIYDDRLLVKSTPGAASYMPSATEELPYPGAKPMLLVDNVDDRAYLCGLFDAMVDDLPAPRIRKKIVNDREIPIDRNAGLSIFYNEWKYKSGFVEVNEIWNCGMLMIEISKRFRV